MNESTNVGWMTDEQTETLLEDLCDAVTPDTLVEIDRATRTVTITTRVTFGDLEPAERAADTIWTRVQDLQAIRAGLEN